MPSSRASTSAYSNDDDDAAPESVSIIQSKADVKRRDDVQQAAAADLKRKTKEKNRIKDENLKKRARETRGQNAAMSLASTTYKGKKSNRKGKEPESSKEDVEKKSLEDRMARAMRDAQDEEDEEDSDGLGAGYGIEEGDGIELEDMSTDGDEESVLDEDDIAMESIEEAELDNGSLGVSTLKNQGLNYLPEHLFSEALSKPFNPRSIVSLTTKLVPKPEQKPKHLRKRKAKDLVLGLKTVRTVSPKANHLSSSASRTLPPVKVRRFYEDRLNLKPKSPAKGRDSCYRKAANIGIMHSSSLPASNFVRNN